MRVLVLGGTGHVGCAIAREAVARRFAVSVVSRRAAPSRNLEGVGVELIRGNVEDIEDRAQIRGLFRGVDLVVDAAAPYPLHAEHDAVTRAVARMRGLVRDVAESGARFVYIGSFVTLPYSHDAISRMIRAAHPYFAVKTAMENVVLDACRRGLRAVLVNPTACLGPWDPKPAALAIVPALIQGLVPMVVSAVVNVVDVRDVATRVFAAVEGEVYGQAMAIGGHDVRTELLAQRICAIAGVSAPRMCVPGALALVGAMSGEAAFGLLGRRSPVPALGMMLLHESRAAGRRWSDPAARELDETLRDAVAWSGTQGSKFRVQHGIHTLAW